jgi:RNA polymerase sigma-70 factor (ECF subfamily)
VDPDDLRAALPEAAGALAPYARMLAGNDHDAADLVQDTIVRALERSAAFDGRSAPATWLRRIMHNIWVDRIRASRESPSDDVAELVEARWRDDDYTVDAGLVVARAEARDDLLDALAHMPATYRTAVVLHDAQGLTAAEVAQVMGVGLAAAKQRIRRARMMLVTELAQAAAAPIRTGVPMRCWEARSQVSDYLDGDLDPAGARALEAHLAGCRTCPPLYASLVGTRTAIAAEPDPDSVVPAELAARIAALLD